jgi:hypothetical protein
VEVVVLLLRPVSLVQVQPLEREAQEVLPLQESVVQETQTTVVPVALLLVCPEMETLATQVSELLVRAVLLVVLTQLVVLLVQEQTELLVIRVVVVVLLLLRSQRMVVLVAFLEVAVVQDTTQVQARTSVVRVETEWS